MIVHHLIAEILALQERIPVSAEEKFSKEALEYMEYGRLKELKFQYQIINGDLAHTDIMTHLN